MADPATITLAIKVAAKAATDKRIWKVIGVIIAALLTPIILFILVVLNTLSAGADHNNTAVKLCFSSGAIPHTVPAEYANYIKIMRYSFSELDKEIMKISSQAESGSLDSIRVKAVFYSLFFGSENLKLDSAQYRAFTDCFVNYEKHTRTVKNDNGSNTEEEYTVTVPLESMPEIYIRLQKVLNRQITSEEQVNASEIYSRALYGKGTQTEGDSFGWWEDWSPEKIKDIKGQLPEGTLGAEIVQLAFTRLGDPYSQELRGTGRYTDCSYLTMWCFKKVSINIPGTAAEQAKFCAEKGLTISKNDLQPRDLIFWSYRPNGRFMNITHVGVYAGNGKVIDASSSKGQVVYRDLYNTEKQVMYGRPYILGQKINKNTGGSKG
ncbi:C40 family peptidase [Ruminiclostridium cellulolyticum]|uniref:NLP/P60 protein n=1 Tax=Ruminiclostridium cellulolyticum (strain ATCC 35319 / DSM 5812 / JCM 6584 / H10) TaxID=394503 RepID=B8I7I4_RUMCH|nr:NlpC/P60 family protein [Ruminiclostridium cellulolyticum]ACL77055.1 NLP/P60 protein [Ruminiclostridium cellulolyticum H10]